MADRVIQRNDTAARWQSINPVLATGELGIVIDGTKGYKIGDGVTPWNDLPYPGSPTNIVQELGDNEDAVISQKVVTEVLNNLDSKISTADEEDITSDESNLLKLKDRNNLNGMGYVVLRRNKTFAEQVTQANTIYEIRYDFDLAGEEVNIPTNCVLKFDGGSLSNGRIIGNRCEIISASYNIFKGVELQSVVAEQAYPEWFGAVGNDYSDDSESINRCLQAFGTTSLATNMTYRCYYPINMPYFSEIKGNKSSRISCNGDFKLIMVAKGCTIKNLNIVCDKPCDVINIETEYCKSAQTTHPIYRDEPVGKITIDGLRIFAHYNSEYSEESKCFNLVANDRGVGISYIYINDIQVCGPWDYAFYASAGKVSNPVRTDWITDVTISSFIANAYVRKGFYIGTDGQEEGGRISNIQRVIIENSSMQYNKSASTSEYFIYIESGIQIFVDNCLAWDFPKDNSTPIIVNPNKIQSVSFRNTLPPGVDVMYSEKVSADKGDYANVSVINSDFAYATQSIGNITRYLDYDTAPKSEDGKVLKKAFFELPTGIYTIPVDAKWENFFNLVRSQIYKGGILKVSRLNGAIYFLELYTSSLSVDNHSHYCYTVFRYDNADGVIEWAEHAPFIKEYEDVDTFIASSPNDQIYASIQQQLVRFRYGKALDAMGYIYSAKEGNIPPTVDDGMRILDRGKPYYLRYMNRPIWWNGEAWVDVNGDVYDARRKGTTSERPSVVKVSDGFQYYDTELGKPIWWNNTKRKWVDATGATV